MKNKGIYYLLNDDKIVYIGKSLSNMKTRVNMHIKDEIKEFDSVIYHKIENISDINILEVAMIAKHSPIYNNDCVTDHKTNINNINIEDFSAEIISIDREVFCSSNRGGMKMVQTNKLREAGLQIVKSSLDYNIFSFIIASTDRQGVLKASTSKNHLGVLELAQIFNTTRKKISEILKRCIDSGLIKKNGRKLVLNPYIVCPHGVGNDALYVLQVSWDSNFKHDISFELSEARAKDNQFKDIMSIKIQQLEEEVRAKVYKDKNND